MKKVFVKIQGGIGNQFFQYAFGEYLKSIEKNIKVIYELSYFKNKNSRELQLLKFNIGTINTTYFPSFFLKIISFLIFKERKAYDFYQINNIESCIYDGYWQNPKYLKNLKNLKKKFTLINKPNFNQIEDKVIKIGIHVRRGDYLASKRHNVIEENYYTESINKIDKMIYDKKIFFVFSDDIKYCKKKFESLDYRFKFVDNFESDLVEFEFLKKMDHLIISNSSFSWWAAYLSDRDDKITICPKKWILNLNQIDLMLNNWICI